MALTEEQALLGAAMAMIKRHGNLAQVKVAERIGELALEGDAAGVAAWKVIARHMDSILRVGPVQ